MSQANPLLSSFNAGELSPLIGGRPDLAKYQAGLSICENFIPRVQGALVRRGGTRYVSEVKYSGDRPWFVRFVFAVNDAFLLEFGNNNIRFKRNRAVLRLDGAPANWSNVTTYAPGDLVARSGTNYYCKATNTAQDPAIVAPLYWHALEDDIYEIPSPFNTADLISAKDGSFAIRYTQSGDVLYLAHPKFEPLKLTRRGNLDWLLEPYRPDGGPFQMQNEDEDIIMTATGDGLAGSSTTITATGGAPFLAEHVGGLFLMEMKDGGDIKPWEVYAPADVGDVRRSDGKYYVCTQHGEQATYFTGTEKPIHTSGRFWDGDGKDVDDDSKGALGLEWEYMHPGYGWVRITGYTSSSEVTATVVSRIPAEALAGTWRWSLPAWYDGNWPHAVCFFRDRLAWSEGQTVYFSQAGDYANFKAKDFGEQLPSSAFRVLVQSGTGDTIEWLAPTQALLVGTGGSVHAISESSTASAFGPTNASQKDQVMPGASGVQPVFPGAILYAEKSGRIVNEAGIGDAGKYEAQDLTVYAEHVTLSGLTAMAYAKQPHAVIWACRADGALVGLTYHRAQQVVGWHRHPIGGPEGHTTVEHVETIPSPDGTRDDVWLLVRRNVDGTITRYVEYIAPEYQDGDDQALSGYFDSHLTYSGAPTSTVSGLDHLEGQTVAVKADGASHADCIVSDGAITLDLPARKVVAGLAAPARAMLMPLEAGAQLGTAQGKLQRIHRTMLRLVGCLGGSVGPDLDTLTPIEYRRVTDDMNAPPPIVTGDVGPMSFPGDYSRASSIAVECDQGFPFTLVSLLPELVTYEG